ncbi:MAG TPA: type II secretion system minor pseudopilin GspI [bacterium]|nr:type II secretion system minor pseudopilin GspI [bacterium]HOL67662.1 type II secretion system minor pseudopilin GspI [bacterium]
MKPFNQRGLTLLEVMISLAIFAVGAIACLESYLLNARNARIVRDTQTALLLAERQVEEFSLSPGQEVEEEGTWEMPHQTFHWMLNYQDLSLSETEVFQSQIGCLTVTWPEGKISLTVPVLKKKDEQQ